MPGERRKGGRPGLSPSGKAVLGLGVLIVLALVAVTSYEIWRQRDDTLRVAESSLQSLSLALASQAERSFHSVDLVSKAVVDAVVARGGIDRMGDVQMHQSLQERISGIPVIVGLAVVNAGGRIVNTARAWPPPPQAMAERDYMVHHAVSTDPGLFIGTPVPSPVDGRKVIPVSRRVSKADGSFDGVVVVGVDPDYFQEFYGRVVPPQGGAFALFRADATLLARHPQVGDEVGKRFDKLAIFRPGAPPKGLGWGPSPVDKRIRVISYNRLAAYPLVINVSLEEQVILAAWRDNALRLGLGAALGILFSTAGVWLLVRQLSRQDSQEEALRASEQRLRFAQFALDHGADMVFWIDESAKILYANQAACARLGYEPGEITRLKVGDVDTRFAEGSWAKHLATLKQNPNIRFDSEHRTRAGKIYPVETSVNYVRFEGGEYICAFVRDITDRKAAEAALAENTARLEASNAELEQFAYVASHDLREPLRMVNSFVTMLARRYGERLDEEGREFIGFAQEGATRMDRLILDLLEYSRVGRMDRPLSPTPLPQVCDLAVKALGLAAEESSARIVLDPGLPTVLGNEEELVRLFLNLVGNALKYRHPDRPPEVRISAERRGDELQVTIADNGIGIAPQYYERIFRIFQRLHGRDKYEGTGIGLAICKKIVERHGGRIWVESTPEQGSRFHFTLRAA